MDDEQNAKERECGQGHEAAPRLFTSGILTQELGVIFAGEFQLLDLRLNLTSHASQVAPLDVAGNVDSA